METKEIINVIEKLSIRERLQIIEKTAQTIQIDDEKELMKKAGDQLYDDCKNDVEYLKEKKWIIKTINRHQQL